MVRFSPKRIRNTLGGQEGPQNFAYDTGILVRLEQKLGVGGTIENHQFFGDRGFSRTEREREGGVLLHRSRRAQQ